MVCGLEDHSLRLSYSVTWQIDGETTETVRDFIFLGSKITADGDCSHEIKKTPTPWKKHYDQPRQHIRKQWHYSADKGPSCQHYGFSSSHVWMWESWTIKKVECRRIDAFELWCWRRLLSSLDYKEIKLANPKENQSWMFIGRTGAEAETPILSPPDAKNWLTGKGSDAGKDWRQKEKGVAEDAMVR